MRARDTRGGRLREARDAVAMVLADGDYDCLVVDATDDGDGVHLELAITSGAEKGDVVRVLARGLARDPIDLLALPARLSVRDGVPSVTLD